MEKADLYLLESHAHLTYSEVAAAEPALAAKLEPRLDDRVTAALRDRLAGASEAVLAAAAGIRLTVRAGGNDRLGAIAVRELRGVIAGRPGAPVDVAREIDGMDTTAGPTVAAAAGVDIPLRDHPSFADDLERARVFHLTDAAKLSDRTAQVLAGIGAIQRINDTSLGAAVAKGDLQADEARHAGRAVALYGLLDARPELLATAAGGVDDPGKLIDLDEGAWGRAIKDSKTPTPGGMPADAYASLLRAKVEAAFPTRAVAARLAATHPKPALDPNGALDELRRLNPGVRVLSSDLSTLATAGIAPARVAELRAIQDAARTATRRYPGLGLDEVLDDTKLPADQRTAEVGRRIDLADRLFADNPDLLALDLRPRGGGSARVVFGGNTSPADRERLLSIARSYQRTIAVAGDVSSAVPLVAAGLSSATAIARSTPSAITAATGMSATLAAGVHARGQEIAINAAARVGTVIDVVNGGFNDVAVYNVSGNVADFLKEIPGYAEFFGSQDYCDCVHCKSIFGPAAYFVDLMRFLADRVTTPYFSARPGHPLALRMRRPDLWDRLELTCENTNTEISYLEVIDEILEDAVARDVAFAGNLANRAQVRDRVYAQELRVRVNGFQQPFHLPFVELTTYLGHFNRKLADLGEAGRATGATLARLRLALPPIDFDLITTANVQMAVLSDIYGNPFVGAPAIQPFDVQTLLPRMAVTRDELGALIATRWVTANNAVPVRITAERRDANSVQNDIERISGLTPEVLDRMHRFVRLWRATGWQIGELDLVRSHLEQAGVGTALDQQLLGGLALIHRMCNVMQLGVEEAIALFSTIPDRAVLLVAPSYPHSDSGETVYPPPPSAQARLTISLLDRLFNQPRQVDAGGSYPQPATRVTHPALALAPPAAVDPNLHRLMGGLGADEDQLYQLIVGLARPLWIRPASAVAADRELALSARNLALLYRHARLARLLRVSVPEIFAIAALTLVHGYVDSLDDVDAVIRTQRWIGNSRWTIAGLVDLIRPGTPAIAASAAAVANTAAGTAVTYTVTENGPVRPAETVAFAANANLGAAIDDWNGKAQRTVAYRADARGLPSPTGDRLAIRARTGGSASRISITADAAGIFAAALPRVETGTDFVLPGPAPATPAAIDVAGELVADVARAGSLVFADSVFARVPGVSDVQSRAVIAANVARFEVVGAEGRYRLRADYDPAQPLAVAGLPAAIEPSLRGVLAACHGTAVLLGALPGKLGIAPALLDRLVIMLGDDLADPATFAELRDPAVQPLRISAIIDRVRRLAPLFSAVAVFDPATLDLIRAQRARFAISDFDRIGLDAIRAVEVFRTLSEPWLDRGEQRPDLSGMVVRYTQAAGFAPADLPGLAELLHCDVALLRSVQADLPRMGMPFDAIEQLILAVAMCQLVGVGGAVLGLVRSGVYADLANASAAIQAAIRAKYADEAEWQKNREPYGDAVLSRQRDGLVAYLLRSRQTYPFDEVNDLYDYFLVDTQLEGVNRTSRVAAAIASVQLYIQRIVMNLEETRVGDPNPLRIAPNAIPTFEWEWRQNYRVWEANRKVFLYPENYLEPELRDDKTPLFRALEDELLSKPITEEAVREAYARYLRGFDEVSSLSIAGSYHERDDEARHDVLHLFATTADDPPLYYYRRVEDAHYGVASNDRATRWGAWDRVDLQIPTRVASPVVFNGQLYLFWVRYVTRSLNQVTNGESRFAGYSHRAHVELSKRRLDGSWTSPQAVSLTEVPFTTRGDGIVLDPLVARTVNAIVLPVIGELRIYSNFQPLYDTVVHEQPMDDYTLRGFGWDRVYPSSGKTITIRGVNFQMWSNVDLFRRRIGPRMNYDPIDPPGAALSDRGVPWVAPEEINFILLILFLAQLGRGLDEAQDEINKILDGRPKNMLWSERTQDNRLVHAITLGANQYVTFDSYTFTSLLLERERLDHYKLPLSAPGFGLPEWKFPQWHPDVTNYMEALLVPNQILALPLDAGLESVNGTFSDAIIQVDRNLFHIGFHPDQNSPFVLRRLGTSVAEGLAETLFNQGLDALLDTQNQIQTNEPAHEFALSPAVADLTHTGELDFDGPMGTYLSEIFFHIPFLLADHLNSLGQYAAAQRWFHVIFDPTSSEVITGIPAGLPDDERRRRELDRVWRYRKFRGQTADTLRTELTKQESIDAYKRDPFNPHAIARTRMTAYQKAIVMKYIDNLLDWGDDLFARAFSLLNPEYLREATLKYVLAQELLGRRPAQLGDCGQPAGSMRYPDIVNALIANGEFLLEVEHMIAVLTPTTAAAPVVFGAPAPPVAMGATYVPQWAQTSATFTASAYRGKGSVKAVAERALGRAVRPEDARDRPPALREAFDNLTSADYTAMAAPQPPVSAPLAATTTGKIPPPGKATGGLSGFTLSFVDQISTVFCVPDNPTLRSYWDRVEDRLYKLRNSLDIEGVFRRLPLFAPPIDPGLLVRARAAGLGVEDILGQTAGGLPPYRFTVLIEKAKSYAATVQGFGAALLGALEKRDGEELANLRNAHEKNLLKLNAAVRRSELAAAEVAVDQIARQQAAAQYRQDYFSGLIGAGLSTGERLQVGFRVAATVLRGADALLKLAAGIGYLIPELGSPFAMKYGGRQLGDSFDAFAQAIMSAATVAEIVSDMSAMIAGFDRREEGWKHDQTLAANDLKVLDRERAAAEIRRDIAQKSLDIHTMTQDQHDEVMDLYRDKFSGFGLYTYMTRGLQQLHRVAFGNALAAAQLAERAYHYELPGDDMEYVGGEWEGARSGLLSGERLQLNLAQMERRFLERNERRQEITQSFSLEQIAPGQLIGLRETGTAELRIPEFYFDLYYPGHYRRQIRGVRVSIPSVTGPYTNVSARLTLLGSRIRSDPAPGAAGLVEVPLGRTVAVATSSGQNDGGVFELSFRDERYNPFEGAGAVSDWRIDLPTLLKPFDYRTISDVVLSVSYTAEDSASLRAAVEDAAGANGLAAFLAANARTRALSLRREYSAAFERLIASPPNTQIAIEVAEHHLPLYLRRRNLAVSRVDCVLVADAAPGAFALSVNGTPAAGFVRPAAAQPPPPFGGLPAVRIDAAFAAGVVGTHTLTITNTGGLAAAGAPARLDPALLRDVVLVVAYTA